MTGIDVHGDVGQVELLQSVCDTVPVARGGVLAGLEVGVGDQVGERIGLDDEGDGGVGVLFEDGNDGLRIVSKGCDQQRIKRLRSMYSVL